MLCYELLKATFFFQKGNLALTALYDEFQRLNLEKNFTIYAIYYHILTLLMQINKRMGLLCMRKPRKIEEMEAFYMRKGYTGVLNLSNDKCMTGIF